MPELPEVQTVVNFLTKHIVGKSILSINSPNKYTRVFVNGTVTDCNRFLLNKRIENIRRRGKYIIFDLNQGHLLFHLRMTGRLILQLPSSDDIKYVSAKLSFEDESELFFQDTRKFGRIYFCNELGWLENKLGIEPLSSGFTENWLHTQLKQKKRMMKPLLMDQSFIAGLGNIYVDEALWRAKIHPKAISNTIGKIRSTKLCIGIQDVLRCAINYKGTTIIDFTYGSNQKGRFKNELKVFGRSNQPCPRCNMPIAKIFVAQRGTHYCKKCQRT